MDSKLFPMLVASQTSENKLTRLASLAMKAGLRGLVCSPLEIVALRQILRKKSNSLHPEFEPAKKKRMIKNGR